MTLKLCDAEIATIFYKVGKVDLDAPLVITDFLNQFTSLQLEKTAFSIKHNMYPSLLLICSLRDEIPALGKPRQERQAGLAAALLSHPTPLCSVV